MISGRAAEAGVWICGPWTESERMPTGLSFVSWPRFVEDGGETLAIL